MGYSTDFYGEFNISPPLNEKEINFLEKFNETRRVIRSDDSDGRYYITDGRDNYGQNTKNILQMNQEPVGQPGLWCSFKASEDGTSLVWDGSEKTYDGADWIKYLIVHFLGNNPLMQTINPELYEKHGFTPHILNGVMYARGEECNDLWRIIVKDNLVSVETVKEYPEEFKIFENPVIYEDPDGEEDEDELNNQRYDMWCNLDSDDLRKFTYEHERFVDYESKDIKEQEAYNIQKVMREKFVNDYKEGLLMVSEINKNSKKKKK